MAKVPYIPRSIRTVELRTPKLPHEPDYQDIPQGSPEGMEARGHEETLEETRVPFGPHKGKMLINLLNDHPGYLLHLSEDSFTDNEAFELKVEEFCKKYEHRLARATGGAQSSLLWAASILAFRVPRGSPFEPTSFEQGSPVGRWVHEICVIEAMDMTQAEAIALEQAQKKFPAPEHQDHNGRVLNIPIAQLRRALKAEQPNQ
jgi:uncharacterized protein (DUF3820 family)